MTFIQHHINVDSASLRLYIYILSAITENPVVNIV